MEDQTNSSLQQFKGGEIGIVHNFTPFWQHTTEGTNCLWWTEQRHILQQNRGKTFVEFDESELLVHMFQQAIGQNSQPKKYLRFRQLISKF